MRTKSRFDKAAQSNNKSALALIVGSSQLGAARSPRGKRFVEGLDDLIHEAGQLRTILFDCRGGAELAPIDIRGLSHI